MAIIQCPNNHYYDDRRNSTCPYCEKIHQTPQVLEEINEQPTSYIDVDFDDEPVTEGYGDYVEEYEKTIGVFLNPKENLLTAGWLVCMEGWERGRSYPVYAGRNFAGRSPDMDIILYDDQQISREKHFSIVYDPKGLAFYIVAGEGHTYLNGEQVRSQAVLSENDELTVGTSRYLFVPFCKEGRDWTLKKAYR